MSSRLIRRGLPFMAMAAAMAVTIPTVVADARGGRSEKSVVGSWEYTITEESPPTPLPNRGVITFAPGGGLVNVDQRMVATPGKATTGLGAWEPAGPGEFKLKFVEFLADPQGRLLTLTLRGTVQLDKGADAFTGSGAFEVTDVAGDIVFSGTNTVHATRMSAT